MKRILVYSHDTFGLGNLRRMLAIARHLVACSDELSVLLVTGSPAMHAFRVPARIDTLKLPCLARDTQGRYGARSLPISLAQTVKMRANLIRSAFQDFEPDLVLVDKKPFGVEDELAGALASMPRGERRPKLVLLLRDILDEPRRTRHVWRKNGCFEAIDAYYDEVLVVGDPAVFDLRREYDFPPFAAAKLRHCGYLARPASPQTRDAVRKAWGVGHDQPWLLVTPGGGEDGHALVDTAVRGWLALHDQQRSRAADDPRVPMPVAMHVVCGPEMPQPARERLEALAKDRPGLTVQTFCDDMMALQNAADVVLAMGGYNTVCEVLSSGRRAVLVPRTEPSLEQAIRAERLAAMGLVAMVHPDQLTPTRLMEAALRELHAARSRAPFARTLPMDGLDNVAKAVFTQLDLAWSVDSDDNDSAPHEAAADEVRRSTRGRADDARAAGRTMELQ